jgi:hypothetical protein
METIVFLQQRSIVLLLGQLGTRKTNGRETGYFYIRYRADTCARNNIMKSARRLLHQLIILFILQLSKQQSSCLSESTTHPPHTSLLPPCQPYP